ncbi:dipeptidase [Citricoccus muralis]|uniref:Dipeptidase n=1 Tax=Citricoccus muralis TaxID=169134 RepID=A0ABY8H2L0_9MICC|nr:dipeptidase [Citricoccus muralis]WFP15383.1 dipeptidase [Citricoccus muralis]
MTSQHLTDEIRAVVEERWDETLRTLTELVAINGIAWPSFDREPLERSADAVATLLRDLGFDDVDIVAETVTHDGEVVLGGPAVLAQRPAAPGKPTVLLYAHHDVQPVGDRNLWESEPFVAEQRGDRLYGRGAADDKAGIMVHLTAAAVLSQVLGADHGLGIRFFIEGEEEAGSPTFRPFLERHRDRLEADAIIVADSSNWKIGVPALTTSLRGLVDGIIGVRVLNHAVHSGMYGGPILDAPTVLARLIATLHDSSGAVAIKGLEAQHSTSLDYPEVDFRRDSSAVDGLELAGNGPLADRLWNQPALSIIGTDIPSIEMSSNTLLPTARAKFSLRLGPGQEPHQAFAALKAHVEEQDLGGAEVFIEAGEFGQPFLTDVSDPSAQKMLKALETAWGIAPVEAGMGGSIPFTADLREVFPQASILITGVEDPDSRAHSANESLHLGEFKNAIVAEALFLADLAES